MFSHKTNDNEGDSNKKGEFESSFKLLTGNSPFPWQQKLYDEFLQTKIRKSCDIPTGLGKTSTIAIWLLALAHHARVGTENDFPRRLVYVVNRRTVVDQATREVEDVRNALTTVPELNDVADALRSLQTIQTDTPLAISTLRGQFADNAEWRNDPTRPAVIAGTVDMIGSRLLFSGYGRGYKSKPLHAAFLGQDTLLVHDEAHLEPAFQELIVAIESEQQRCHDLRRLRVMALTATSRLNESSDKPLFTNDDRQDTEVKKRINAKKGIVFCPLGEKKKIADEVAKRAMKHKDSNQAILVFLRKLGDVKKVVKELPKGKFEVLTGTLRGLERDELAKDNPIFARFMPMPKVEQKSGTVYLVCTSAGEVGVNISADHLVCDLTPFDSMAQRFGRVNRFGQGDAGIDIIFSSTDNDKKGSKIKSKQKSLYDEACEKTLSLLQQLPKREDHHFNASPAALNDLPVSDRKDAFTPAPIILPTSDILFDAWALTSIREQMPGRPPIADWLHGIAEWDPPETHVAWREEVGWITGELLKENKPEDLLEDYPLKPHELLRDNSERVFKEIKKLAGNHPEAYVWPVEGNRPIQPTTLGDLVKKGKEALYNITILLPPEVGGLKDGLLNGRASFNEESQTIYDVADEWKDENDHFHRCRVWDGDELPEGMRLVRSIHIRPDTHELYDDEQQPPCRIWYWYIKPFSATNFSSQVAKNTMDLQQHLDSAEDFARELVSKLSLGHPEAQAIKIAAKFHDLGKDRSIWQRSIQNMDYPEQVLAKSKNKMLPIILNHYRHEFGSLIDILRTPEYLQLSDEVQDLVLHLISAHHGRARPHFPEEEAFDPTNHDMASVGIAREVPRRFVQLQQRYGRWGLAYLESLVRAADALASQSGDSQRLNLTSNNLKTIIEVAQ